MAACVLLLSFAAFGQATSGDLVGSVADQSGAVVVGAAVTAVNTATGISSETKSNASGNFRFSNLSVGSYNLTIKAAGFKTAHVKEFPVVLNQTVTAKVTMEVGQVETVLEVTDVAPAIDTSTAQLQ